MKPRTRIQKEVVRLSSGLPELTDKQKAYAFEHCFKHHASSIMPTAQKAELSLVRNVDTAGKADTLLRKLYVAVAVPIAERNLKYLIPEREFSGATHIMKSLRPEKAIKCCATLW